MKFCKNSINPAVAIGLTALAITLSAPAAAQSGMGNMPGMSGMSNMPGMDMPDTKEKKPKPATSTGPANGVRPVAPAPKAQAAPDMKEMGRDQMTNDSPMPSLMPKDTSMQGMQGMQGMQDMQDMQDMQNGSMGDMKMGPMQGGSPPPNARDPDANADGLPRMAMPGMEMADDARFGRLLANELEFTSGNKERGQKWDIEGWYGGDYNKLWLKAEGSRRGGRLESARTEALWDRAISTYWSTQLGVRHDNGGGPSRNWLAFGVQGLAPYWFETEATGYVGRNGSAAARVEVRYDLLFTQKLILQPRLEANFYSKNDPERRIGSGLSDIEFGLRLRYEITRQVAPYIGISWERKNGNTANYARQAGESTRSTRVVAGVRLWF